MDFESCSWAEQNAGSREAWTAGGHWSEGGGHCEWAFEGERQNDGTCTRYQQATLSWASLVVVGCCHSRSPASSGELPAPLTLDWTRYRCCTQVPPPVNTSGWNNIRPVLNLRGRLAFLDCVVATHAPPEPWKARASIAGTKSPSCPSEGASRTETPPTSRNESACDFPTFTQTVQVI